MLLGVLTLGQQQSEAADQPFLNPPQSPGFLRRIGLHDLADSIDSPFERECVEPGDIPLAPWDRAPRTGSICDRWHAHHNEKKAWHYYIRGVGPAVHERSPGRPCLW